MYNFKAIMYIILYDLSCNNPVVPFLGLTRRGAAWMSGPVLQSVTCLATSTEEVVTNTHNRLLMQSSHALRQRYNTVYVTVCCSMSFPFPLFSFLPVALFKLWRALCA